MDSYEEHENDGTGYSGVTQQLSTKNRKKQIQLHRFPPKIRRQVVAKDLPLEDASALLADMNKNIKLALSNEKVAQKVFQRFAQYKIPANKKITVFTRKGLFALFGGYLSLDDLADEKMTKAHLELIFTERGLSFIHHGIITASQMAMINISNLREIIFTDYGIALLENKLLTPQQIDALTTEKIWRLARDDALLALSFQHLTFDNIQELDIEELDKRILEISQKHEKTKRRLSFSETKQQDISGFFEELEDIEQLNDEVVRRLSETPTKTLNFTASFDDSNATDLEKELEKLGF